MTAGGRLSEDLRNRFGALLENSEEFIALADLNGTVLYVNAAGRRLVGIAPHDDVRATRMVDYVPPDRVAEAAEHLRWVLKNGRWSGEFEYLHFITGERVPVYCNAFVFRDESGNITLAQVTRDLRPTRAAQAEQRAAYSAAALHERKYQELADALPQIVWTADANGVIDYFNRRWFTYTGIAPRDAAPLEWQEAVHPSDYTALREPIREILRTGLSVPLEIRLRAANGEYRWHLVTLQLVRDEGGEIAKWIGIATDIESQRRSEERQRLLSDVSRRLSVSLDLNVSMRGFLGALVPAISSCGFVNLGSERDPAILTIAAYHNDIRKQTLLEARLGSAVHFDPTTNADTAAALLQGRAISIVDMQRPGAGDALGVELRATLAQLDMRAAIVVPFVSNGALRGTLVVARSADMAPFTDADIGLLEELVPRVTATIANARLYERERRVADVLQRASLPATLPSTDEVAFWGHYLPGASEALIGGDWYDAMRLPDGRFLISIGDVAGSGLAAAVIMGNVRQIMRGVAQIYADPAFMLDAADRALRAEYPDRFVTAVVAVYDPATANLTYASAGHPPPYLVSDDRVVALDVTDLPLGLREGAHRDSTTVSVPRPAHVVFYTDGLIESNRNITRGERDLLKELRSGVIFAGLQPSKMLVERLLTDGVRDDVAVLIARVSATSDDRRMRWSFDARDEAAADLTRAQLMSRLASLQSSADDLFAAELVFGELLSNVVRHTPGPAEVILDLSTRYAVLHIIDTGAGFRHSARLPADPMSERGRGLFLVSSVSRDITVMANAGGGSHAIATLPIRA